MPAKGIEPVADPVEVTTPHHCVDVGATRTIRLNLPAGNEPELERCERGDVGPFHSWDLSRQTGPCLRGHLPAPELVISNDRLVNGDDEFGW